MAEKYYSFFNGQRLKTEDGKVVVPVTTSVVVASIKEREVEGHKLVSGRAAISMRNRRIASLLDVELPDEEVLWVDVNFWDDRAERFLRFLGDREKVRMCLVGNMKARTFDREDGTQGVGVSLSVQDWFSLDRRSETA